MLRAGLPVRDKLIERNDGRGLVTTLQVNVEQRGVEFVPGTGKSPRTADTGKQRRHVESQAQGGGKCHTDQEGATPQHVDERDGSIRPISKWAALTSLTSRKPTMLRAKP